MLASVVALFTYLCHATRKQQEMTVEILLLTPLLVGKKILGLHERKVCAKLLTYLSIILDTKFKIKEIFFGKNLNLDHILSYII